LSGVFADFVRVAAFGAFFFAVAFLRAVFPGAATFFPATAFFFTGVVRDRAFFAAGFLAAFLLPLSFLTFTDFFFTAPLLGVLPINASENR
jgi:hypothetical protein